MSNSNNGKKRKVSINPLFDYQTNKQVSSPASSERSNSNDYTNTTSVVNSPSNLNYLQEEHSGGNNNNSNPTTPINSSSLVYDYTNHLNGNSNSNNNNKEKEIEITKATKNVVMINSNLKSNSNSSSFTSTSNLYSPLNSLSIKSPTTTIKSPTSSSSHHSYPQYNSPSSSSTTTTTTVNMMDQLHSPYLHQDIYPSSTSTLSNNILSSSPFLTHSSTPTSPNGLYSNSQQQQQQQQQIINQQQQGLNLSQLHSPLQHQQSGGSSYYSPDISPSTGTGLGTSQDAGFLHQLAQLSNNNNSIPPNNGGGGVSPFGMMDVGMTGILNGGMEMKGKGRETLDHNGQIIREVATRRGEDLGIGLGDFDMLDTLGTGTFGKVLLARLHPPSNPFNIRSQSIQPQFYAVKVLEKLTVVRLRQVEHLNSERSTLAHVSHPFIVNLLCTFQDERNLYLLLEYVQGGELFSHLRRAGRFSSDVARFYAANLILALEYLHSQDIIYRDLKPENLLIDGSGYIKITDFGFAKHVTDRTYTLCGTPEYLAPEIITATGHGKAADFWAFGVLLFELLAGYPPFFADNPLEIYEKILTGKFGFPPHIDYVAKDLIKRLLTADLSMRLGNLKNGAMDVKNHRWFEGVDWSAVERKEIRAPIIPQTSTPGDTSNFERYPASPLEDLPGPLRAHRARQYQISPDSLERGQDPYGYLFPCF